MKRKDFVKIVSGAGTLGLMPGTLQAATATQSVGADQVPDRVYWSNLLYKIASPVLTNMSEGKLKENMPIETPEDSYGGRKKVTYLEALGRTVAGIAPWLALEDEGLKDKEKQFKNDLTQKTLKSIVHGVDPSSPDYLNFTEGRQPLVDTAFLVHGLLRAPKTLWEPLDTQTKKRLIKECRNQKQEINPYYSNWLLFGAMVDAFLYEMDGEGDMMRMDYAIKKHQEWYLGDGWYGDGPEFHFDLYNSYVIHSMLVQVLKVAAKVDESYKDGCREALNRMRLYAGHQERLISPEGTYPPMGRSITYRIGAFQTLAEATLFENLPDQIAPAQVRAALTAVMKNQFEAEGTFNGDGWLQIGFCGHQPEMGDPYISTGSLYLCTLGFLPLGLKPSNPFWANPPKDWTTKKAWNGEYVTKR
jgi:hypothetical protein